MNHDILQSTVLFLIVGVSFCVTEIMARFTSTIHCDTSYMDGVQMKVADAYKPPRKIALPPAYYSKLPDVSKYTYDTSLEKNVIEKVRFLLFNYKEIFTTVRDLKICNKCMIFFRDIFPSELNIYLL